MTPLSNSQGYCTCTIATSSKGNTCHNAPSQYLYLRWYSNKFKVQELQERLLCGSTPNCSACSDVWRTRPSSCNVSTVNCSMLSQSIKMVCRWSHMQYLRWTLCAKWRNHWKCNWSFLHGRNRVLCKKLLGMLQGAYQAAAAERGLFVTHNPPL